MAFFISNHTPNSFDELILKPIATPLSNPLADPILNSFHPNLNPKGLYKVEDTFLISLTAEEVTELGADALREHQEYVNIVKYRVERELENLNWKTQALARNHATFLSQLVSSYSHKCLEYSNMLLHMGLYMDSTDPLTSSQVTDPFCQFLNIMTNEKWTFTSDPFPYF